MHPNLTITDNDSIDLEKLREMAKIASIYHKDRKKFRRNPNFSYLVHASLHIFQSIVCLCILLFHHIHHRMNKRNREDDPSISHLPEEMNPIFLIYPLCMIVSTMSAVIWLFTDILTKEPKIDCISCFVSSFLMITIGIIEMKHADDYIDLTVVSDDELLLHPIFIHNFIMCLLSVFCMCIYLIQAWTLFDYHFWLKKRLRHGEADDSTAQPVSSKESIKEHKKKEAPGKLDPIPVLEAFPSLPKLSPVDIENEPAVLYCCCVDWYNHIKQLQQLSHPLHEFQVIRVA